ncbi:MAG: SpoIIIAH-like family protein [Clostridiales bacterium]|nr:SpoIIIAH-like family protein [Clostridiales bacterium]MCF8021175.1 SpoIIIAH-like family protein [Clostridiales bacterium]
MLKIIRIHKSTIVLSFLTLLGIIFLVLGWSKIPQKLMKGGEKVAPAAIVAENNWEDTNRENKGSESKRDASMINMQEANAESTDSYFINYRLKRQRMRSERLELLREIINNPSAEKDSSKKARESVLSISKNMARETELENLIRAKGFDDAVVFLQPDSLHVVVKAEKLSPEEAERICDMASRTTGTSKQDIVIIPRVPGN